MQNSGERSFIGNVASGAEESADFYVTPTEAGKMEGEVVISYEDASMNVREVTRPFTIMVEEMPYVDPGIDFPVVDPQPIEEPSLFTVQNCGSVCSGSRSCRSHRIYDCPQDQGQEERIRR